MNILHCCRCNKCNCVQTTESAWQPFKPLQRSKYKPISQYRNQTRFYGVVENINGSSRWHTNILRQVFCTAMISKSDAVTVVLELTFPLRRLLNLLVFIFNKKTQFYSYCLWERPCMQYISKSMRNKWKEF